MADTDTAPPVEHSDGDAPPLTKAEHLAFVKAHAAAANAHVADAISHLDAAKAEPDADDAPTGDHADSNRADDSNRRSGPFRVHARPRGWRVTTVSV